MLEVFMYQPYAYLIGWSSLDKWYYGIEYKKYRKEAQPSNLWVTYFTSCHVVHTLRLTQGEPDIIQIRRTFKTRESAIIWEKKVLKRLNVLRNPKWINSNVAGAIVNSPEMRARIAEKNRGKVKHSPEERARRSEATRKRNLARGALSEETKLRISVSRTGKPGPKNRSGTGNPMHGRAHSEETKRKMSDAIKLAHARRKITNQIE